ncbi:MAG: peptidoglycan-associated lipoprotein Pal [Zoogloeaceae bacterium]|jgi:peptidoglycan-associated lipoprotein|nr:peptidoglycan-associated lipoprotein Pal [Zoogloeaceae bacterium]
MKKIVFRIFVALAALTLAGCPTAPPRQETDAAPVEERGGVARVDTDGVDSGNLPDILTKGALSKRSVYFALDRYDIEEGYRDLVAAHARFLAENRGFKVLIQGNTDERGSREYNLSLGQKRAEAVRQMLLLLGVQEAQVEAVSLGEEKPRAEGHNETAWAENRRADILYSGEF